LLCGIFGCGQLTGTTPTNHRKKGSKTGHQTTPDDTGKTLKNRKTAENSGKQEQKDSIKGKPRATRGNWGKSGSKIRHQTNL